MILYFQTTLDTIALELCVASLQDYAENRYNGLAIDGTTNYTHDFIYFY